MGAINNAFNKAGWSILALAQVTSKYRSKINEEKKNRAKQSYTTAATIKKQNNELTKSQVETPKSYFSDDWNIPPEKNEQKIAEQKVLKQMAQEKAKATSFGELVHAEDVIAPEQKAKAASFGELAGVEEAPASEQATSFDELPTVSAEHSETNISAKDPEVQGLIEVKQKNALRAAASQRSQNRYQNIKEKLTSIVADEHNIDDVWRNISLAPDITDEMIRKAGFTKTKILEEWKYFNDWPTEWMERINNLGDEYGVGGDLSEGEVGENFGRFMSAYIRAKAGGKTLAQQQEEYDLSKAEKDPEFEENYKVWQDESTEKEKDKVKTDRNFSGFLWQDEFTKDESTKKEEEKENDEAKKDKGIIF